MRATQARPILRHCQVFDGKQAGVLIFERAQGLVEDCEIYGNTAPGVMVQDEGVFDRKVPVPELDGTAGRGIPIMLALVDEVTIREGTPVRPGTQVRLRKAVRNEERIAAV